MISYISNLIHSPARFMHGFNQIVEIHQLTMPP